MRLLICGIWTRSVSADRVCLSGTVQGSKNLVRGVGLAFHWPYSCGKPETICRILFTSRSACLENVGLFGLRKLTTLVAVATLSLASGCATDIGSFTSSDPAPAPGAQQQVATNQPQYGQPQLAPIPPAGQATFAPAPKPGAGGLSNGSYSPAPMGRKISEAELRSLLAGKFVTVADGRRLEYGPSGSYQETRNGQTIAAGTYQIRDVSVCVQFTTGLTRCDSFVQDGNQLFVEDRNGQRLPARIG